MQVVNTFLEQMDGIGAREGVVVVAACNDATDLDPAIMRSGRLDRTVHVPLPNGAALEGIMRHHLGSGPSGPDLSLAAAAAAGATGADVAKWVRGARRAARRDGRPIDGADLLREFQGGRDAADPATMRRVAVHEAGHAVVACLDRPRSILGISLTASGQVGGRVSTTGFGDLMTRHDIGLALRKLLAGRAAEEALLGQASTGAGGGESCDLARATVLAVDMLCSLGMSDAQDLAWRRVPGPDGVGAALASDPRLAASVSRILSDSYAEVLLLARQHAASIGAVADLLVERRTLSASEVERLVPPTPREGRKVAVG